jgi:hypothetical protein
MDPKGTDNNNQAGKAIDTLRKMWELEFNKL